MFCFNCGKQIPDNSKFCSFCGTKIVNQSSNDENKGNSNSFIDYKNIEQDIRKGTLIYLHDILSLEFSINKLQNELKSVKTPMTIHDYWFFWKCYYLQHPIHNKHFPADTKIFLSYSYKLNRYYYAFGSGREFLGLYDYNGNKVNHNYGLYCGSEVLDLKTRNKLCTLPVLKNSFFSGITVTNQDETYWPSWVIADNSYKLDCFADVKASIEQFEDLVKKRECDYQKQLPLYKEKIQNIEKELEDADRILKDLYSLNIIPAKYRNIGCAYFIYDFFSTSNTPLDTVFLHLDLNQIQSQLNQIINNQQDIILQQAIIISQNEEIIAQNQQLFNELSNMNKSVSSSLNSITSNLDSINKSSAETSQWAKMAALNAETCAWLGIANYLK